MNYIEVKPNGVLYEVSSCFDTNFAGKAKNYIYQGNLAQSMFTAKLVYNNDQDISAIIVFDTDGNIIESLCTLREGISLKDLRTGEIFPKESSDV